MKVAATSWRARWTRLSVGVALAHAALIAQTALILQVRQCDAHRMTGPVCGVMPPPRKVVLPPVPSFEPPAWEERYDFDGDGRPDRVVVTFSGGAHCCYTIAIESSARGGRAIAIPFWMDGGYIGGLDPTSQPDHFRIEVGADGVAAFLMEIATYNGRAEPIPKPWRKRYGVRSHRVRVGVRAAGARLQVENLASASSR